MTMRNKLAHYAALTDTELTAIFTKAALPEILDESMRYSVFAGGKRLRPALCMAACELAGGAAEDAVLPACAIEMLHAYSLIHDDLPALDNDDMRRGRPSNHIAFGEANAILAGDALQSLAFVTAAEASDHRVMVAIAQGALDMAAGQSYDLTAGNDETRLLTIHRLKTGALIRAAVLSGAYCASADASLAAALETYAERFGLLFQITDDILDTEGDAAALGKSVGKDAEENKLTFVSLYGLAGAKERAAENASAARAALAQYGERASFFAELADQTLTRRS